MISAILLAAGQSRRMNGENKLTKKFQNIPLVKHAVENILSSNIDELIIILGYQENMIEKIIGKNKKIKFVLNKNFKTGMASSIIVGLQQLSKMTESFFICLGDMPLINSNVYNQLIISKKINNKEIIVPTYKGSQGNPVLFSISMKKQIMNIKGDAGAKKILEKNKDKIFHLETNHQGILKNYNTQDNFNN